MTLEQLRIFIRVAECLSMTRAAGELHLSQPAVSAAVAALEGRYATRLFDRVGRRLELSAEGRLFLPEARAVLERAAQARLLLDDLAGLVRGSVRLVASQTVATYWLPARMARFAAAWPGLTLSLDVGNTAHAVEAMLEGTADLAFVEGETDRPELARTPVGGDRLGLYAAAGHPLAGRRLTPEDLRGAAWVLRESGSGTRAFFARALADYELELADLTIRLELPSNGAVLTALAGGELIAPVSDMAATACREAGRLVRLDCPLGARTFHRLVHRERHLSRACQAFLAATTPEN